MITLTDLTTYDAAGNWTAGKVTAAGSNYKSFVYKAVLKQYAPEWSSKTAPTTGAFLMGGGSYTISGVVNTTVIAAKTGVSKVFQYNLPNENGGAQSWATIEHITTGVPVAISMSEPVSTTDPHLFWAIGNSVFDYNVGTNATVERALGVAAKFVAGTVGGRFHFVYKTAKNNWRLGYVDSLGTVVTSDIYWPYKVNGFTACRLGTGQDIIMMSTELPPVHDFTVNDRKIEPAFHYITGIVSFSFSLTSGQWSDHTVVWKDERDLYDINSINQTKIVPGQIHATRYANEYGQDEVFAVAPVDIGYATLDSDRFVLAFFKSPDGKRWESPVYYNSWPWTTDVTYFTTNGAKLIRNGNYMYIAHPHYIHRALATCWMGDAASAVKLDVTSYVTAITLEASQQRTCSMAMTNPAGVLTGSSALLGKGYTVRGYVWTGYHANVSSVEVDLLVPSFTGFVTGIAEKTELPQKGILVSLSDPMEIAAIAGSSDAVEWPSMSGGGDNFAGTESGINYSGLGHCGPITGTWKSGCTTAALGGSLMMQCEGKEGIASNTYVSRGWNGLIGATLRAFPNSGTANLPVLAGYDKMGLFFREADKNNLWMVRWKAVDTAEYRLVRRYAGSYNNTVQNGTFESDASWSKGAGTNPWSITGGEAVKTAGTATTISQALLNTSIGARYTVKWRISSWTSGSAHVVLGTTACQTRAEIGVFTEDFDSTGADLVMTSTATIAIVCSTDFVGKIDDVELVPVAMDYECPNYTGGVGVYTFDNSGHPYDGGELTVRWRYNWVEVFLVPYGETTPTRILYYELIGRGTDNAWTQVTLENGHVGYPIDTGNCGYIATTHNDSRDNLIVDYNPGAEDDPLVLTLADDSASGWSNQMTALATRVTTEHHWGEASVKVVCGPGVYSTGVRIARYFSASDNVIYGDTYDAEAWFKISPNTQVIKNTLRVFVEIQYTVGSTFEHTISEYQNFRYKTDNNGWFKWSTTLQSDVAKRPAKVIIEAFHGNGEADWLWLESQGETLTFYVDDVGIYSESVPSHKQYMAFSNAHVSDGLRFWTLQDACRNMLGYAGVECDKAYKYDSFDAWTLSGGMALASGNISSSVGSNSLATSPDSFAPSMAVDFDKVCPSGKVYFFGTNFAVAWTATDVQFIGATTKKLPLILPDSCHVRIAVWARADNSRTDKAGVVDWLTLALYADDAYVASWSFPVTDPATLYGVVKFGAYSSEAFAASNLEIYSMYRLLPFHSIDPGEKVTDGIGRAVANYRVLVHSRFNGHVEARMFPAPPHASVWSGATTTRVESAQNARSLMPINFWRVNGAWKQADWVAHAAHQKAWKRIFEKLDNPNLMTAKELEREVVYITQDIEGQISKPGVNIPYMPLLEVGDCIEWNSEYMLIEAIRTAMGMQNNAIQTNNEIAGRKVTGA